MKFKHFTLMGYGVTGITAALAPDDDLSFFSQ